MSSHRNELDKIILFASQKQESLYNSCGDWSQMEIGFVCPNCRTKYTKQKRLIFSKKHSYCRKCGNSLSRRIDISGERYGNILVISYAYAKGKETYWNVLCDCGKRSIKGKQNMKRGNTRSCGCLVKNNGCVLYGEDHPNWNSNLTQEERERNRDTLQNTHWRYGVYSRDRYACVLCGDINNINAHHLYGYSDYPQYRYDINNGVTLCSTHHKLFHKTYGNKSNTPDQYREFVENALFDMTARL